MSFEKQYIGMWVKRSYSYTKFLSSTIMVPGTYDRSKNYFNCYNLYVLKDDEDPKKRRVTMRTSEGFIDQEIITEKTYGEDTIWEGEIFTLRTNQFWKEGTRRPEYTLIVKKDIHEDSLPL